MIGNLMDNRFGKFIIDAMKSLRNFANCSKHVYMRKNIHLNIHFGCEQYNAWREEISIELPFKNHYTALNLVSDTAFAGMGYPNIEHKYTVTI